MEGLITIYCKENKSHSRMFKTFKTHLKSYSKKLFYPFCRGERIKLIIRDDQYIETTVGQLNYFRFVIENNIIEEYLKEKENVDKSMIEHGFKKRTS